MPPRPMLHPRSRAHAVLALVSTALLFACKAPQSDTTGEAPVPPTSASGIAMVDNLGREMDELADKMIQLAEAMPESTYGWAPMEGVRSVGAVFAHVAGDNYFVPALLGKPVEGTGVTTESGIKVYEDARGTKAEIVAELRRSFAAMNNVLAASRSEPDKEVLLRGNAISQGDLWVRAVVHLHEHLGQAIAYARANQIAPPWSAGS